MGRKPAKVWLAVAALGMAGTAGAQPAPVPPPAEQQTADCGAPVFATDQLVCSDPALRALDSELAARLAEAPELSSRWIEPQHQWFLRRSRCAFAEDHAACAEAAYRERLALLGPLDPKAKVLAARCHDAVIEAVATKDSQTFLLDRQHNTIGIATTRPGRSSWQPFLTAKRRGRMLIVTAAEGASLKCTLIGVRQNDTDTDGVHRS